MKIYARVLFALVATAFLAWLVAGPRRPTPRRERPTVPAVRGVFAGAVTDSRQRSIEGATIEVLFVGVEDAPRIVASARTDAQGVYSLPASRPKNEQGALVLRASAEGFAVHGRQVESDALRQDFVLTRERTSVTVDVRDEAGRPVQGTEVVVAIEPSAGSPGAMTLLFGHSGGDGRIAFDSVPATESLIHWSAVARGRGVAVGEQKKAAGDEPVRIDARLDGGVRIAGEVVDSQGAPVAGVELHASQVEGPWIDDGRSDARGAFSIVGAPRGRVSLEVRGDWVLAGGQEKLWMDLSKPDDRGAKRVVVESAGVIAGRVTDRNGAPIAEASIRAIPSEHMSASPKSVVANADGRFEIRGLRAKTSWDLDASDPQHAPAFQDKVTVGTRNVELRLSAGGVLAGRVVDDRGAGVGEIEVYAHKVQKSERAMIGLREHATVKTAADGTYRLEHINEGTYRVEVASPGKMGWTSESGLVFEARVEEGKTTTPPDTKVSRAGEIRGRVHVALGRPPVELTVSLLPDGERGAPHRLQVRCAADGSFAIPKIEPGTYSVTVHDAERGYTQARGVRVTPGGTALAELVFQAARTIEGVVTDAEGRPVEGATVDVFSATAGSQTDRPLPGRAPDNFTGNVAQTDGKGRFVVTGVADGRYRLRVTKKGMPGAAADIDVPTAAVQIALPRAATLEVELAKVDRPASRVVIVEGSGGGGFSGSGITDDKGVARFDALPPGSYRVRAIVEGTKESSIVLAAGEAKRAVVRADDGG